MDKLRVGIIGCGRIADLNALGYRDHPRARIYAVCDLDRDCAERRARQWGAERVYADYRRMLEDDRVRAVEVITPHHLHAGITVDACNAGKHVAVQKPMALNIRECDAMIQAAERNRVKLKVYENFVFYPPYVKAAELIAEGAVGEPLAIRIKLGSCGRGGWPVPLKAWLWRLNCDTCGGGPTVFDDGYHKFSIAVHLMGEIDSVFGWIDRSFGIIDAPAVLSWTYKNPGRIGTMDVTMSPHATASGHYYSADERVEITGTEGVIFVTRCTARLLDQPPLMLYRDGRTTAFDDIPDDWARSFIDCTHDFVESVLDDREPLLTGRRGREVTQFALAAHRASESGRVVRPDEIVE